MAVEVKGYLEWASGQSQDEHYFVPMLEMCVSDLPVPASRSSILPLSNDPGLKQCRFGKLAMRFTPTLRIREAESGSSANNPVLDLWHALPAAACPNLLWAAEQQLPSALGPGRLQYQQVSRASQSLDCVGGARQQGVGGSPLFMKPVQSHLLWVRDRDWVRALGSVSKHHYTAAPVPFSPLLMVPLVCALG